MEPMPTNSWALLPDKFGKGGNLTKRQRSDTLAMGRGHEGSASRNDVNLADASR